MHKSRTCLNDLDGIDGGEYQDREEKYSHSQIHMGVCCDPADDKAGSPKTDSRENSGSDLEAGFSDLAGKCDEDPYLFAENYFGKRGFNTRIYGDEFGRNNIVLTVPRNYYYYAFKPKDTVLKWDNAVNNIIAGLMVDTVYFECNAIVEVEDHITCNLNVGGQVRFIAKKSGPICFVGSRQIKLSHRGSLEVCCKVLHVNSLQVAGGDSKYRGQVKFKVSDVVIGKCLSLNVDDVAFYGRGRALAKDGILSEARLTNSKPAVRGRLIVRLWHVNDPDAPLASEGSYFAAYDGPSPCSRSGFSPVCFSSQAPIPFSSSPSLPGQISLTPRSFSPSPFSQRPSSCIGGPQRSSLIFGHRVRPDSINKTVAMKNSPGSVMVIFVPKI
ncbi:hypothetical protein HOD08_04620 [bacterium]|nr:hypothetical protein [bacterium]